MSSLRTSLPGLSAYTDPERPLAGRYVIQGEIGRGGMAFVVLATDLRHNRPVAIKVLRGELASTVNAERFVREIEIAAGLTHPHILPVHDSGAAEGILFYVMPFVEGETLAARIQREGALSVGETVRLTREIAGALEYAHGHGIVHRDIKPENVLLPGGVAVVADFGLARALEATTAGLRITEIGAGIGTPTYLSPEQALGAGDVDARSDQYSLACVVFEMLTGRPPFDGKSMQAMLAQHISKPPPKASELRPGVPARIDAVLSRALAKSPSERYASVREFMDALDSGAAGARGLSISIPRSWRAWVAAAAVVVAVGIGALVLRANRGATPKANLDDNLIAVVPFDVIGTGLELWHEGLMDVIARSLDGAGPLRTVSPTIITRSWTGRGDRASVGAIARANHAGLAVFGQIVGAGGDSVRATISLYDVRGDSTLTSGFELREANSRIDRAADSLTVRLIRTLSHSRRITTAPVASLGAHSLPALKAFLAGEQLYRKSDYAGAKTAFEESLGADSNFALAYHRMADVTRWLWTSSGTIGGPQRSVESSRIAAARARDFDFRAGTLNHGLSQRDSLMILANSLLPMPYGGSFVEPSAYARMQRRFAALERAASLYPNDGEVLAALGTGRLVITRVGSDVPQTLAVFEQAIHADSTFGPGYPAAVRLSLAAGNRDSALAYGRRYLRINPGDLSVALPVAVLEGDGSDRALRQALQRFPKANAGDAAFFLAHWPDSNETALRLFRVLEAGPTASSVFFGSALRFRGHIQEALRVDDGAYRHSPGAASELLFLSHYSQVEASALDSLSQQWVQHDIPETFPTVILREADRRDTAALSRMVQLARRREEATRDSTESLQWRYLGGLANAARALVIRDSASAEAGFLALQDSLAWESSTAPVVTTAARLLNARGRAKDALSLLQRHPPSRLGLSAWQVAWYIEVAKAYMNSGDLAAARRALRPADAIWYHADSVLVTEKAALTADLRRRVGPL